MQPEEEFDTIVLLSSIDNQGIALGKTKKLFIFNRGDSDAHGAPMGDDKSTEPKQAIVLGGSGHQISALVAEKSDLMQDVILALKR